MPNCKQHEVFDLLSKLKKSDDQMSIDKCRLVEIFQTIIINLSKNHYSEINDDKAITFQL